MNVIIHNVHDALFDIKVLDNGVYVVTITAEVFKFGKSHSYPEIKFFFDNRADYLNFKRSCSKEFVEATA